MTSLLTAGELHTVASDDLVDSRYRLITLLHSTPTTETWRAHDSRLEREVVVQLTQTSGEHAPTFGQLQAMLSQSYAHLSQVYDAGTHAGPQGSCTFVVTALLAATP